MRAYPIVLLGFLVFRAEASDRLFRYAESVRGATIPFYSPGQPKPYAALRVERVSKDFERRGFFRIGLLPLLVAERVTLRFLDPNRSAETFASVSHLSDDAADSVEWRTVQLIFDDETAPRFEAARMRLSRNGGWRVWDAIVRSGTNELRLTGGHLSGQNGSIFFRPNGDRQAINLSATRIGSP